MQTYALRLHSYLVVTRPLDLGRRSPALRDSRFDLARVRFDEGAGWLTLERGPVLLAAQLRPAPAQVPLPAGAGRFA